MTTRQLGLFDAPRSVAPRDPHVNPEAAPRLSGQSRAILAMLRERPRTGAELATVTHRFGGRLYDLRRAGCTIDCDLNHRSGVATYTLTHDPGDLR